MSGSSVLRQPEIIIGSNRSVQERYLQIRTLTRNLCEPLQTEDFVVQPMEDVSPPKWHLGHTTWFFENFLLSPFLDGYRPFNEKYGYIFNSYYESVGKRVKRANRGNLTRPSIAEIWKYRDHVDTAMIMLLEKTGTQETELYKILELGLNHEQQHQELLLTDLKFILGTNPLLPAYQADISAVETMSANSDPENYLVMEEGLYDIGYEGTGFCFDNEMGRHRVFLHAYRIMDRLVTNEEYLEFMKDGGYTDFRHWLAEGWDWVNNRQVLSPLYWFEKDGEWYNYTLKGARKVVLDEPVTHISFYEADAYAKWKGRRLPTEFEWEAACNFYRSQEPGMANILDTRIMSPASRKEGEFQFIGDAWEWTNSAYLPYPYYQKAEGALGEYNGKFMVNQMVLRGGSCATPASHMRVTYRNFFPADKQWQFSGIRLAEHI
jgi:ergothioneine biosynthesis protein EgtB